MIIKDIEKTEKQKGVAYILNAGEFIPAYAEKVQKFLRDNQSSFGDSWVQDAGNRLYRFSGKGSEGELIGSNTDMGVAIATFCPEMPLIAGQQLLNLYSQAGNKNPFGKFYIDFGVQVNGEPKTNYSQAKILLEDLKARNIEVGEGRVPNFNQLRLIADKNSGLAYKLADDVSSGNIAEVSVYPFEGRIGKDGLFGAYLYRGGWDARLEDLAVSLSLGRVVRYDAEGVMPKKLPQIKSDLIKTLTEDFIRKF